MRLDEVGTPGRRAGGRRGLRRSGRMPRAGTVPTSRHGRRPRRQGHQAPETQSGAPDRRSLLDLSRSLGTEFGTCGGRGGSGATMGSSTSVRHPRSLPPHRWRGRRVGADGRDPGCLRAWRLKAPIGRCGHAHVLAQREAVRGPRARHGLTAPDVMRTLFEAATCRASGERCGAQRPARARVCDRQRHDEPRHPNRIGMLGPIPRRTSSRHARRSWPATSWRCTPRRRGPMPPGARRGRRAGGARCSPSRCWRL